jgi:hypothetical protein
MDDFLYPGLHYTIPSGIVADSAGNLYVAATTYDDGSDSGGSFHWIVRRSVDGGATWSIVDDFVPGGSLTEAKGLTVDATGNVYVVGTADYGQPFGPSTTVAWTIRKGIGGTMFRTVYSASNGGGVEAVFAHPTAGLLAAGSHSVTQGKPLTASRAWVVLRSLDGGATWSTLDTFQLSAGYAALATGIGADALGNLYVVGHAAASPSKPNGEGYNHWVVRRTSGGSSSWTTVDNFQYQFSSTGSGAPGAFAHDSEGNLFVAGWGALGNGPAHWLVRESVNGTGSWATVDDFEYTAGASSIPTAIAANASRNVFVGGGGSAHWLVRRR